MIRTAECPAPDHVGRQAGGDTCFPPRQDSPAVAASAGPIAQIKDRRPECAAHRQIEYCICAEASPGLAARRRRVGRCPAPQLVPLSETGLRGAGETPRLARRMTALLCEYSGVPARI